VLSVKSKCKHWFRPLEGCEYVVSVTSFGGRGRFLAYTQDEWIVSSWKLYPKSSVHVLDLTNGKTMYMFVDKFYPIRATLLERMLRHRLTVPPSYCRDVVVAGSVIQMVQTGLQQSYECLASAPL
ncbi:hypothetical protein Tco_0351054, partial [Tanacetum coccineum]